MRRLNTAFVAWVWLLVTGAAFAADIDVTVQSHQITTSPPGARYEIVQSTLAAKITFRLDRFNGRVWQLVRTADDDSTWEEMQVQDRSLVPTPNRARFQIFTSGLAVRHTFLIDGDTGKTWLIVTGKRKDKDGTEYDLSLWQPFAK